MRDLFALPYITIHTLIHSKMWARVKKLKPNFLYMVWLFSHVLEGKREFITGFIFSLRKGPNMPIEKLKSIIWHELDKWVDWAVFSVHLVLGSSNSP